MFGGGGFRGRDSWLVDWPDAEYHFLQGISRLTRVNAAEEGPSHRADGTIIFLIIPGFMPLKWVSGISADEEAARLRDYLFRGGFLMVDDFHGSIEWAAFHTLPGKKSSQIDPLSKSRRSTKLCMPLYDLDKRVPNSGGRGIYDTDKTYEEGRGSTPSLAREFMTTRVV